MFLPRCLIFVAGVVWIDVEKPLISYKEYLGPEWTPTYEGTSTLVFNHSSWVDILVGMWWNLPSFLSKNGVKSYPGVGIIAESIQCVFLNRVGTKEEKRIALQQISER